MSLDVTISPTVGAPVLFTDGGIGEDPGYTMVNVRRMIEASTCWQEGVVDAAGWKVTEKAGGTNMSVDVAADVGLALVDGDNSDQARYIVAPHTSSANLATISGNSSGNPRVECLGHSDASRIAESGISPNSGVASVSHLGTATTARTRRSSRRRSRSGSSPACR
jgi:hypothetical protein